MIVSGADFLKCAVRLVRVCRICRPDRKRGRCRNKVSWVLFSLCIGHAIDAGEVRLAWDPGPGKAPSGFRLYAGTNSLAQSQASAQVRLDTGTNTECIVSDLAAGRWYFVATAYLVQADGTNWVESLPSNELILDVPATPRDMRTVVLQWNATLSGTNWLDVGFFRVRLDGGR